MNKYKYNSGFTLIELMIVIAIVAILMAYAIPAYRNYTVRAKAGEGVSMAASLKSLISEHWVNEGEIASLSSGVGNIPAATALTGNNVSQISVAAGVIEVTYFNDATLTGETLRMTPNTTSAGSLTWVCTSSLEDIYLPIDCR